MALQQIHHLSENEEMASCIDNCFEAAQASEWCADECIQLGDPAMASCITLCRDVADLSTIHARLMARGSSYEADLAAICAKLCEECALECEQFDHEHCQVCAEVLHTCASSCREMAA